jgi:hypothetical protein
MRRLGSTSSAGQFKKLIWLTFVDFLRVPLAVAKSSPGRQVMTDFNRQKLGKIAIERCSHGGPALALAYLAVVDA